MMIESLHCRITIDIIRYYFVLLYVLLSLIQRCPVLRHCVYKLLIPPHAAALLYGLCAAGHPRWQHSVYASYQLKYVRAHPPPDKYPQFPDKGLFRRYSAAYEA